MRIAILGATSQIASDLVVSLSVQADHELTLYTRRPAVVAHWLTSVGLNGRYAVADFSSFNSHQKFDALVNFVGVGNPARAAEMGASIFDVTLKYDDLALNYVRQHPECRYVFLSSGAAYGSTFEEPADDDSQAEVAINHLRRQDWYGVAKLHAECRHRSFHELPIIDLRVFNYVSRTQDLSAGFLITDALRAIRDDKILSTSPENIVRDYLHPGDMFSLVNALISSPATNTPLDCFTRSPISKFELLDALKEHFGLKVEFIPQTGVNATGIKPRYYSLSRKAEQFGYQPARTSLEGVMEEAAAILNSCQSVLPDIQ